MASPAASRLLRQVRRPSPCPRPVALCCNGQRCRMSSRRPTPQEIRSNESDWAQRSNRIPPHLLAEFRKYPTVTADMLCRRSSRPRKVKMLMRDFIHDSLYNPHYGYFSKQAVIFTPGEPFDFPLYRHEPAFTRDLGARYTEFEDHLDAQDGVDDTRQLWHTPTELFRPHYGEAIAAYLVKNYRLSMYPYKDLIIYEMGAGRGTLMLNILDYLRDLEPDVYERTKYRIIEISPALAAIQKQNMGLAALGGKAAVRAGALAAGGPHTDKVEIINRSIFDWKEYVSSPCFFLAMEVIDNFAHDCIRYDLSAPQPVPMQSNVLIDGQGEFYELFTPDIDPVAAHYLRVRHRATDGQYSTPYMGEPDDGATSALDECYEHDDDGVLGKVRAQIRSSLGPVKRAVRMGMTSLPWAQSLSLPEYVPTRLLEFFEVLEKWFPAHRLLLSDFHALPDAIGGLNAPVVQTRYKRETVLVSTPLVHQGYFDILFPTNFHVMDRVYRAVTGKHTHVTLHEDFMRGWASLEETETQSGENPLLTHYKNASMMMTL